MGKASRFTTKKEIRKELASLLKGETIAGDRVFPNRTTRPSTDELPMILIYPSNIDYTILRRDEFKTVRQDLIISIQIIATDSDEESMSDQLDDLSEEIDELIESSDNLNQLVHDINIDTAQGSLEGEGDQPEGSWTLNYNVTFIKKPKE